MTPKKFRVTAIQEDMIEAFVEVEGVDTPEQARAYADEFHDQLDWDYCVTIGVSQYETEPALPEPAVKAKTVETIAVAQLVDDQWQRLKR